MKVRVDYHDVPERRRFVFCVVEDPYEAYWFGYHVAVEDRDFSTNTIITVEREGDHEYTDIPFRAGFEAAVVLTRFIHDVEALEGV